MRVLTLVIGSVIVAACSAPTAGQADRSTADRATTVRLATGWTLQSSGTVREKGDVLSRTNVDVSSWHRITVPSTVVGALVESGHYPDPYVGMNLRKIPGTTYPIGKRFTPLPIPQDSPFAKSWWYRTEFRLPAAATGRSRWLHFDGINYRASIWLNGQRLAASDEVAGAFRRYRYDITGLVRASGPNVLAVEVTAPRPDDLAMTWVDWNPDPPDKNMGLWGDVYLTDTGPIAIEQAHVMPDLDLPSLETARLTISADVHNATASPASGTITGVIGSITFSQPVSLAAGERKTVMFAPADVKALTIAKPRVWWPYRMGEQPLYTLELTSDVGGARSDRHEVRFGIQEMSSELTDKGHRLFRVNGKPILIRGGGWAPDMLLRPKSTERLEAELRYTREMGLNTIRIEGRPENDEFYDLANRLGILVMAGWSCCDQWELWDKWDEEDHRVAQASLRDQILRLRNHPSVFVWLNGSDGPPPAAVERTYLDVLKNLGWTRPVISSATAKPAASGPSGVKMNGPYDYVPPSYWLADAKHGGAFGFATEVGPGGAVPPLESLEAMLPADRLWPINDAWKFHSATDEFYELKLFTAALEGRYGKATGVEDYARKAQALAYEGQRAMFEAYARNKYTSTGVIQWMLNNAWPSMFWHLYDYYLRPGGGYYGTKKANEPLHVQYSYDNRTIAIVNDRQEAFRGLRLSAELFDLNLVRKFSQEQTVDVAADSAVTAFAIPKPADLTTVYFVRLRLAYSAGRPISSNFYWLSTREDVLDWAKTDWYHTPVTTHADLTALATLPATTLAVSKQAQDTTDGGAAIVTVENTGRSLAFQVHLKLVDPASGGEVLPVFWDDNYVSLLPGEKKDIRVGLPRQVRAAPLAVEAEAWNVSRKRY